MKNQFAQSDLEIAAWSAFKKEVGENPTSFGYVVIGRHDGMITHTPHGTVVATIAAYEHQVLQVIVGGVATCGIYKQYARTEYMTFVAAFICRDGEHQLTNVAMLNTISTNTEAI